MSVRLTYRVAEVSELTGIPTSTLYSWIRSKRLKARPAGKVLLIPAEELHRIVGDLPVANDPRRVKAQKLAAELLRGA